MDMEQMLGEIRMFAGDYAPVGWMFCQGQTLQISQYAALFSILGPTYGGDGHATFCLPDLRGRVPVGIKPGDENVGWGRHGGTASSGPFQAGTSTNTPYLALNFIIAVEGQLLLRS